MKKLISYGGGINSTAMAIWLYQKGSKYPIVFADTGNEQPETYFFLPLFEKWLKNNYQSKIVHLTPKNRPDLYAKRIRENGYISIEDYCLNEGKIPMVCFRWCTGDWKRDPVRRWGKERDIYHHIIGIAADESHRAKESDIGKYKNEYPLVDSDIDRKGCEEIIKKAGLPIPIKSGCTFCPYQKVSEWRRLYTDHYELFDRAAYLEANASAKLKRKVTMRTDNVSLEDFEESWKQENPLFPELRDFSSYECPFCHL